MERNATTSLPQAPEIPRPGRGALRLLAWLVALTLIYAYGWKVTEINLKELAVGWTRTKPLLHDLIRPDLLARYPRLQRADTGVGLEGGIPPQPEIRGEGRVKLTPASAKVGDRVTVTAERFAPSRPIEIIWRDKSGATASIAKGTTDPSGRFETAITVPKVVDTSHPHHVIAQVTLEGTTLGMSNALRLTLSLTVVTVFLALIGTTMAVVFAVPLSFLGAKNLMGRSRASLWIYYSIRTIFNIARSIEPLIMATVFVVWVGISPFAGVLALGVHSIASLGKLYSEQIESIDPGPIEAITATGASMLQIVRYAVVPQIVPPFIAFTIYRWDINVRMSTVIGMVGGGGLGSLLIQYTQLFQWRQAATAIWAITAVVAAMDYLSAALREKVV